MTGGSRLSVLVDIARRAGAHEIPREAEAVAERAREGRFYVVCVGQFKRGKFRPRQCARRAAAPANGDGAGHDGRDGDADTPGIGSVSGANTAATREALEALRSEAEARVPRQEA